MNYLTIGAYQWSIFVKDRWYSTDPVEINLNNFKVFNMRQNSFILTDEQVIEYFPHFAYLVPKPVSQANSKEDEDEVTCECGAPGYHPEEHDGWGDNE
jgi:hypothetical protein